VFEYLASLYPQKMECSLLWGRAISQSCVDTFLSDTLRLFTMRVCEHVPTYTYETIV
jgi:hypothetical protein